MSAGSSMMPAASAESSSSAAEHIIPFDTTPRTGFFSSVIFEPGMYVPSGANTPTSPARAFGAPHTTSSSGAPFSTSTWMTCSLSAFGCLPASTMRAMRNAPSLSAGLSTLSTSRPIADRRVAISSTVALVFR